MMAAAAAAEAGEHASAACGVGVTFGRDRAGLFVVKALAAGGPAEVSGNVLVGDMLVTVDGRDVKGIRYDELTALILGAERTKVIFGLRRPSAPAGAPVLIYADLFRARVGPVGRPAQSKTTPRSARGPRWQVDSTLQTLAEEDPSASLDASSRKGATDGTSRKGAGALAAAGPAAAPPLPHDAVKCGVGLTFRKDTRGYFTVLAINPEACAAEGGPVLVLAGDTLLHAAGMDVKDLNHAALAKLILGPPLSVVRLGLRRRDGSHYVTNLTRSKPVGDSAAATATAPAATPAPSSAPVHSDARARGDLTDTGVCDVGLRLHARTDGLIVVDQMLAGGPAAACALIRPGDLVLQAEGQHVTGMPLDHVYHLLLGARGSPCVLLVGKHDGGREEVVLTRTPYPRQHLAGVPNPADFQLALA